MTIMQNIAIGFLAVLALVFLFCFAGCRRVGTIPNPGDETMIVCDPNSFE